jgi:predicted glutamine amidotransferase
VCRLFAALSTHAIPAAPLLFKAPQSLLHQSRGDPKRPQSDGWGVGWFSGKTPRLRKSAQPIFQDAALLQRVAREAEGSALLAHARWASNPLKLPREALIGPEHTQPFVHGGWIFAHNGTLFIPNEVKAVMGQWASLVQGKNDSEVLFYWLMKDLGPLLESASTLTASEIASSLRASLLALHKIWEPQRKTYPQHNYPYHGLNCVLTNGEILIAFCLADPRGFGSAKALLNPEQPYYEMQRRASEDSIIVASEPIQISEDWVSFRNGELLLARREAKKVTAETASFLPAA